jgi:putative exosortase-associated protein (TIGR04073 family)
MKKGMLLCAVLLTAVWFLAGSARAGEQLNELGRGLVNVTCGWVEIPGNMAQVSRKHGPWIGIPVGIVKGGVFVPLRIGQGFTQLLSWPWATERSLAGTIGPSTPFGRFSDDPGDPTANPK